jgi:hypothetical protein
MLSCSDSNDPDCIINASRLHSRAVGIKDLVTSGNLLPVEGFAQLVDYAMYLFDRDIEGMMWGTTNVIVGYDPNRHLFAWTGPSGEKSTYFVEQDWLPYKNNPEKNEPEYVHSERGDWRPEVWDDTANQAFHFWYWVGVRYYDGVFWYWIGNLIHEPIRIRGETPRDVTWEDYNLSEYAKQLGKALYDDAYIEWLFNDCSEDYQMMRRLVPRVNPGAWIRTNLKDPILR